MIGQDSVVVSSKEFDEAVERQIACDRERAENIAKVRQIVAEVRENKRSLHRIGPVFAPGQVERLLRVEINADIEFALHTYLHDLRLLDTAPLLGPRVLEGVDWYVVHNTPEPGWRVINPLAPTT